jgi:TPR repeat protein
MRAINYLLIVVFLLAGCTSVFGQDYSKKSVKELFSLAEQSDAEAQYNLGVRYENGRGVRKNQQKAFWWWRVAAEHGHPQAQYNLGSMYDNGHGVPQSSQLAVRWYRRSAAQGNAQGQFFLGFSYKDGEGVPNDHVLAYKWFNLSAAQGHEKAAEFRDKVATEMTPSQISEAQKLSREFKPRSEMPQRF